MKFLCIECDKQMAFAERELPGDGTLAAVFTCPACSRSVAMLTNPMETQLVASLGVQIGGRSVPEQPFELTRGTRRRRPRGRVSQATPAAAGGRPVWDEAARERLARVPSFVRGMVQRIYADYAAERHISVITTEVMDTARRDLGLEGM